MPRGRTVNISTVAFNMRVEDTAFNRGISRASRSLDRFGREGLKTLRNLAVASTALGAAALVGFGALSRATLEYQREISDAARATRLPAAEFNALARVFRDFEIDIDSTKTAIIDLEDRIQELRDGAQTYVEDFRLLNLEYRDFIGLNQSDRLLLFIDRLRTTEDQTAALAGATRLLSTEGEKFLSVAAALSDRELRSLVEQISALGGVIDQSLLDRVRLLGIQFGSFQQAISTRFIGGFASELRLLDVDVGNFRGTVQILADAAENAGATIARLIDHLVDHRQILGEVARGVGLFVAAWAAFATLKLAAQLSVVAIQLGLLLAPVAAVAYAALFIQQNWDRLPAFFGTLAGIVQNIFEALGIKVRQIFLDIRTNIFESIRGAFSDLNSFLRSTRLNFAFPDLATGLLDAERLLGRLAEASEIFGAANTAALADVEAEIESLKEELGSLGVEFNPLELVRGGIEDLFSYLDAQFPQLAARFEELRSLFDFSAAAGTLDHPLGDLLNPPVADFTSARAALAEGAVEFPERQRIGEDLVRSYERAITDVLVGERWPEARDALISSWQRTIAQVFARDLTRILVSGLRIVLRAVEQNIGGSFGALAAQIGSFIAPQAPTGHSGGIIRRDGLIDVRAGEALVTAGQLARQRSSGEAGDGSSLLTINNTINGSLDQQAQLAVNRATLRQAQAFGDVLVNQGLVT